MPYEACWKKAVAGGRDTVSDVKILPWLMKSLSLNPAFMKIIRRARAEVRRGEVYSLKQVKQELLAEADGPNKPLPRTRRKAARR